MSAPRTILSELLAATPHTLLRGSGDLTVREIACDSRRVTPGTLYVCASGYPADRHAFLPLAAEAGAVAAVVETGKEAMAPAGLPLAAVADTRRALADLSVRFWNRPSERLELYGVTGTNGKTTSTSLLSQIFRRAGGKAGVIGTLGAALDSEPIPSDRTTPEANDLQRLLFTMAERGARTVAMEVSSHALALGRVRGCRFAGALFTNLTQDHLDFHDSLEDYFQAKARLFTEYGADPVFRAAINGDDDFGKRLIALIRSGSAASSDFPHPVPFGLSPEADVRAEDLLLLPNGVRFRLATPWGSADVSLPLMGLFNVYNALGVAALALAAGIPFSTVVEALEAASGVPGRFERIDMGQAFGVVVDYAHTPDGIENVLRTARGIAQGRVICIFGCGGDRDPGKRPKMARIAGDLADRVIVTSDNPRSENPEAILNQILSGITDATPARVEAEVDRRQAIFAAIREARTGDVIVIAGKGHEDYQILANETIHFDDREVAREALREAV